jgi:two-component system response regulator PilR (NtrC family)
MTRKRALVVDDEPDIRELIEITLGRMGVDTRSAEDVGKAKTLLKDESFDCCLTDMRLPDGNGIELVQHIQTHYPHIPVAMITAHGNMESAVDALKAGAFDFVSKPVNLEQLRNLVDTALNLKPFDSKGEGTAQELLGETPGMEQLRRQITKLARSQAPIYISGESGSGKELVARLIHDQGPHASGLFVPVNCGAIPTELMESEFFGHTKGSFTGAVADKEGLFQAASGGTLFLDEVADLPLAMQVKLLRGIQEKAIRPIGGQKEIPVDVRILSATHKNLAGEVKAGNFRQDLYYRINVIELKVPSLRERRDDIPLLAAELLNRVAEDYGVAVPEISKEAMEKLIDYPFPGNVRELQNILERALTLSEGSIIKPEDLHITSSSQGVAHPESPQPDGHSAMSGDDDRDDGDDDDRDNDDNWSGQDNDALSPDSDVDSLESYLEDVEKNAIVTALDATRWNRTAAAKKLGITLRALRYKLKKLNLE